MKLIVLTLLILASTAYSTSVENLNDAIENLDKLVLEQHDGFLTVSTASPDQESYDLAAEYRESIPKLEKIQRGLRRDGHSDVADKLTGSIAFARKFTDPQFVQDNKSAAKILIGPIRNLIRVGKRYLDDEDLFVSVSYRENNLEEAVESLDLATSESVNKGLLSISTASPDQESYDLAAEYRESIPKLEKIQRGLRRDGHSDVADKLTGSIAFARKFTDPQFVQDNKSAAKILIGPIRNLIRVGKRYLDDEDLFVSISEDKKVKLEELKKKLEDLAQKLGKKGFKARFIVVKIYINAIKTELYKIEKGEEINEGLFNFIVKRSEAMLEEWGKDL